MLEFTEKLTAVIRLQSEIIDEMFLLLLQHVSTEDESLSQILDRIEETAERIHNIEADPLEDADLPFSTRREYKP